MRKGTKARRHEGTKKRATKPRSHEATEGNAETQKRRNAEDEGTEARRHEATEGNAETQKRRNAEDEGTEARRHEAGGGKRVIPRAIILVVTVIGLLTSACVRRTINITTEPPNARVFLNDQEVGRSAVTTDFLWYGDYGVTIRKEGYETLQTNWIIKPPWYQRLPLDFFTEVLWPGQLHDTHSRHFILEPAKIPTQEELIGRAGETRDRALDARK